MYLLNVFGFGSVVSWYWFWKWEKKSQGDVIIQKLIAPQALIDCLVCTSPYLSGKVTDRSNTRLLTCGGGDFCCPGNRKGNRIQQKSEPREVNQWLPYGTVLAKVVGGMEKQLPLWVTVKTKAWSDLKLQFLVVSLISLWSWACDFTSRSRSILTCNVGIVTAPISAVRVKWVTARKTLNWTLSASFLFGKSWPLFLSPLGIFKVLGKSLT